MASPTQGTWPTRNKCNLEWNISAASDGWKKIAYLFGKDHFLSATLQRCSCRCFCQILLLDISAKYFCGTRCQTLLKDTIATQFLRDIFVRHTRHTVIKHFCHTFYSNAYIGHFVKHSRVEGGIHSFYANIHLQIRQCINKGTKV